MWQEAEGGQSGRDDREETSSSQSVLHVQGMTTALVQMRLISYCYTEESVRSCDPYRKASLDLCVFQGRKNKEMEFWCSALR